MRRVLLIEDSAEVQIMVRGAIGQRYELLIAETAAAAEEYFEKTSFDLFLIDIMLPDGNGFELCAQLKNNEKTRDIPVIFLTTKNATKDKVMGFAIGADDYIAKPFDPLELRARVDSKMRKIIEKSLAEEYFICGPFRLSIPFQKVFLTEKTHQREIALTPNEFKLTYFFMRHEGHVLSRARLLEAVWGHDLHVNDRTVDSHVCSLRKKLNFQVQVIESVFGEGYRFSLKNSGADLQMQTKGL